MPDSTVWNLDPAEVGSVLLPVAGYLGFAAIWLLGFALLRMLGR